MMPARPSLREPNKSGEAIDASSKLVPASQKGQSSMAEHLLSSSAPPTIDPAHLPCAPTPSSDKATWQVDAYTATAHKPFAPDWQRTALSGGSTAPPCSSTGPDSQLLSPHHDPELSSAELLTGSSDQAKEADARAVHLSIKPTAAAANDVSSLALQATEVGDVPVVTSTGPGSPCAEPDASPIDFMSASGPGVSSGNNAASCAKPIASPVESKPASPLALQATEAGDVPIVTSTGPGSPCAEPDASPIDFMSASGPGNNAASCAKSISSPVEAKPASPQTAVPDPAIDLASAVNTRRRRSELREWSGYSGCRLTAEETCKRMAREMKGRQVPADQLLEEIGVTVPSFTDDEVADALSEWSGFPNTKLSGQSESQQESYHQTRLNQIIVVMQKSSVLLPEGVTSRHLICRKNRRVGFAFDADTHVPDGQDGRDFRPDGAFVKSTVKSKELDLPGGYRHIHVPVECKTATGTSEIGQVGAYAVAFRAIGSRYQTVLAIRETTLRVYMLSPTAWSIVLEADYREPNKRVLEILAFVTSDAACDDSLAQMCRQGLPLMTPQWASAEYERRLCQDEVGQIFWADAEERRSSVLGRPFFSSENLWGARSQAWEVEGSLVNADGHNATSGRFVLTSKLLRKGKAVNSTVYSQRLRQASPAHAENGWFEESIGISLDVSELRKPAVQRLRVVELLKGPRWRTWDEVSQLDDITVMRCFQAFRDCLRSIWTMRPLHHRDVSIDNLLITSLPMSTRVDIELEEDAPGAVVGRLFDFGNARWGAEPSDSRRRHERTSSMAADDVWTGTYHFLSRAALLLDDVVGNEEDQDRMRDDMRDLVRTQGQHRHWHDLESLFLCLAFLLGSRFRDLKGMQRHLTQWLAIERDSADWSFLPQARGVMLRLASVKGRCKREQVEIKHTMHALRTLLGIFEGIVGEVDYETDVHVRQLFDGSPAVEKAIFKGVLKVANDAIAGLLEVEAEARPKTLPDDSETPTRSLRTRQVQEYFDHAASRHPEADGKSERPRKRQALG